MKISIKYILIIFSVLFFSKINAQENIESLLKISVENNPSLKAKFNKHMADLQKVPQVGSLPDPNISFGYFIEPMELVSGNQRAEIQLMQMFPWFGTLKASKNEASAMALSSFELFRAEKEEIFYKVRTSYYQLFLTQKQLQTYDTTRILLKSIEDLLLTKLGTINTSGNTNSVQQSNSAQGNNSMGMNSGNSQSTQNSTPQMSSQAMPSSNSTFSDLLRIQVEIKELDDNIAMLQNRKQMLNIQINLLLNRTSTTEIIIDENLNIPDFDFHNPTLFDSIKVNNPMIKMNKSDLLAYQELQQMNRKMGFPMIGLGLNYSVIDKSTMATSTMNGKDMIMPMLTMSLPIYRKKYNASVKEAQYLESSASEQLINIENMLFMEFSEYQFSLNNSERKLLVYNDIISLTQKSFDLLVVQYSSSGTDFEALIRLHRQLLDYKLNIYQAQVDKLSAIAGFQKLLSKN